MKNVFTVLVLLLCRQVCAQEDYILKINDSTYKVALDKVNQFTINGKKVSVSVSASDTLTYVDDLYSFRYPKGFSITKMQIEEGVEQVVVLTADGAGMIIQKYLTLNPSKLNETMLAEVTKEKLNYGYSEERDDYKRTLPSGQVLTVDRSVLTYKQIKAIFEVMSFGGKDEGLMIITIQSSEDKNNSGKNLIDMMWNTLTIGISAP